MELILRIFLCGSLSDSNELLVELRIHDREHEEIEQTDHEQRGRKEQRRYNGVDAINRETLVDAQKNPELYRHLIVRVWGWSGYFIELDKPFQDQVIKRVELASSEG